MSSAPGKSHTLLLLSPRQQFVNYPAQVHLARMFGKRKLMIPLALPTVAALTPDHYDIRICDEEIESVPRNLCPDVVGITTLAATSQRAFELGDWYRARGSKVVFGGPFASNMVQESLKHCDSVVVGEGEEKWEECLRDFESGNLKPVYSSGTYTPYRRQKPPRWDLVRMDRIFQVGIQVSRGCPYHCDFCLVPKQSGNRVRAREIRNVEEEIRAAPVKYLFFVDDNLTIQKQYAQELMEAIKPLGISWGCMCSIDVARDEELLQAMAQAGCFNILIGFESLNPESLDAAGKHHNLRGAIYEDAIRRIHAHGIHINASFVVGFDHDTPEEFDRICDFTLKQSLPYVNLHLLHAPPGSDMYERYREEDRLLHCNPQLGVGHFPMLRHPTMSPLELFARYMESVTWLYSFETILQKAKGLFTDGTFIRPGSGISLLMRFRLLFVILKEFLFSRDRHRRELLFLILTLIRKHRLAADRGIAFLLVMLGNHRHISDHRNRHAQYLELIQKSCRA